MNKKLIIIGAGGHGRVIADIASKCNYSEILFLDDHAVTNEKVFVVGKTNDYMQFKKQGEFIIAIGNNLIREKIFNQLFENDICMATLIHPDAVVGNDVVIASGTVVMAGAVINSGTTIGKGCIINTCSSVDHDCKISDFCHISVGSHLAGTVKVGERTFIGAGATVINNVDICNDCMIGAGAVVVKNIEKSGTYVGVPAKAL